MQRVSHQKCLTNKNFYLTTVTVCWPTRVLAWVAVLEVKVESAIFSVDPLSEQLRVQGMARFLRFDGRVALVTGAGGGRC